MYTKLRNHVLESLSDCFCAHHLPKTSVGYTIKVGVFFEMSLFSELALREVKYAVGSSFSNYSVP